MQKNPTPPQPREAMLRELAGCLRAAAPDAWTELRYTLATTTSLTRTRLAARLADGSTVPLRPPAAPGERLRGLREEMYEPGKGTWFSARYVLVRPDESRLEFDYDTEPDFGSEIGLEVPPLTFVRDLDRFPRDERHMPGWLRRKTREAEER